MTIRSFLPREDTTFIQMTDQSPSFGEIRTTNGLGPARK